MSKILEWLNSVGKIPSYLIALATLIGVVMFSLGFRLTGPSNEIATVNARVDSLRANTTVAISVVRLEHDYLTKTINEINSTLKALAIAECIDRNPRELQLMQINCGELLNR